MSNRFHNKWHRRNHHTDPAQQNPNEPDATHDPIASHEDPFRGDFVVYTGTVSAQNFNLGGYFRGLDELSTGLSAIGDSFGVIASGTNVYGVWGRVPDDMVIVGCPPPPTIDIEPVGVAGTGNYGVKGKGNHTGMIAEGGRYGVVSRSELAQCGIGVWTSAYTGISALGEHTGGAFKSPIYGIRVESEDIGADIRSSNLAISAYGDNLGARIIGDLSGIDVWGGTLGMQVVSPVSGARIFGSRLGVYAEASDPTNGIAIYGSNPRCDSIPNIGTYPIDLTPRFDQGLAGYFDGNVHVQCALSANSIWSPYLSATYADVDIINVHIAELEGYTISGHYYEPIPENYICNTDIGLTPYEALVLNGVALSGNSWAAFNGDIIGHRDAYVERTLVTNNISGCQGTEISVWSDTHFASSVRIDGDLRVSGDKFGGSNLYLDGSAHIGGDLRVDGLLLNPTATNIWVQGTTYTDCILPWPNEQYITIGCSGCTDDLWDGYDTSQDFGLRVCGNVSANAFFGLLNTAQTELILTANECFEDPTWNEELWSQETISNKPTDWWDGVVIITTEADEASGYAHIECYTDDILVGQMVVGNPGNITNSNISHPLSAQRILENKQVITFPVIGYKPWSVKLVESYGKTCHDIRVYRNFRSTNISELWIDENFYVGGSSIFEDVTKHFNDVYYDCNDLLEVGGIEFCEAASGINLNCNSIFNLSAVHNDNCVDTIHFNKNIHVDTVSALVLPAGDSSDRSPEIQGAVRYNTSINSFEGFHGDFWAGLGGVTKVDSDGNILGTSRAMIGPVTATAYGDPEEHDIWFDTTENVIKRYDGNEWVIFGAAYL